MNRIRFFWSAFLKWSIHFNAKIFNRGKTGPNRSITEARVQSLLGYKQATSNSSIDSSWNPLSTVPSKNPVACIFRRFKFGQHRSIRKNIPTGATQALKNSSSRYWPNSDQSLSTRTTTTRNVILPFVSGRRAGSRVSRSSAMQKRP
uniref:(northern house mosquito) hypothetical protein n=1 Tax=Culex pipiens TaxID=7175 RepID=A0A8D8HPI7_CULPI